MNNLRLKKLSLVIAGTLSLSACGGGGDGGSDNGSGTPQPAEPTMLNATIIDGYLNGAKVWLDLNYNHVLDDGEPTAMSGEGGKVSLDVSDIDNPEQYSLIAQAIAGQTIDESRNETVHKAFVMTAPKDEVAITPLSTEVQLYLEQTSTGSETETEHAALLSESISTVASSLGLDEGDVLGDYIAEEHDAALYAAENIVASGVLPEEPSELETISNETPDNSQFMTDAAEVAQTIQPVIEEVESSTDTDFDDITPVYVPIADDEACSTGMVEDAGICVIDTDGDGIGNHVDTDDDGDDVPDIEDFFPLDPERYTDIDICKEVYVDGDVLPLKEYDASIPWQRTTIVVGYEYQGQIIPHNVCDDEYAVYDKYTSIYGHRYAWAKHGQLYRKNGKPTKITMEYSPNQDASYWLEGSAGKLVPDEYSPELNYVYGDTTWQDVTPNANFEIHYHDSGKLVYRGWRATIKNEFGEENSESLKNISNYDGYDAVCVYYDALNRFGYNYSERVEYDPELGCENEAFLDEKFLVLKPFSELPVVSPDRQVRMSTAGWSSDSTGGTVEITVTNTSNNNYSAVFSVYEAEAGSLLISKPSIIAANGTSTFSVSYVGVAERFVLEDADDGYIYYSGDF